MTTTSALDPDRFMHAVWGTTEFDSSSPTHAVDDAAPAIFTWDYEKGARPQLSRLYEKAKGAQWNAETDLPWDTDVDPEALAGIATAGFRALTDGLPEGSPLQRWSDADWIRFGIETQRFAISQFLHGEQGALLVTAKIVESVPWIDAKFYGATQVMDEARHVEVFAKYLDTKLEGAYPINNDLRSLLDALMADERWDLSYLGMQIMVEGLALAAFGLMRTITPDPLLEQLLRYVMADEARHVAFGVVSLAEVYDGLTAAEIADRQAFAFATAEALQGRLRQQEVFERLGVDHPETLELLANNPMQQMYQQMLFSKIVPNLKKIGLLDAGDGWLRQRFGELGILHFETAADTSADYEEFALTASP